MQTALTLLKYLNAKKQVKGFTLIELLVVIAIIVILALTAFVVINPLELQRRSRDSVRISDLATINQAITAAVADASDSAVNTVCPAASCTAGTVYTSKDANARKNDGTGWVKTNLTSTHAVSIASLALDPSNSGNSTLTGCTAQALTYRYEANANGDWELDTALESKQYQSKMNEGGNDTCTFEVGSLLTILN